MEAATVGDGLDEVEARPAGTSASSEGALHDITHDAPHRMRKRAPSATPHDTWIVARATDDRSARAVTGLRIPRTAQVCRVAAAASILRM